MSNDQSFQDLLEELKKWGVPVSSQECARTEGVFPLEIPLADQSLVLHLDTPAFLSNLNPNEIGFAVLDPLGYLQSSWGLAREIPYFSRSQSVYETEVAGIMDRGARGSHGALYFDGVRYFGTQGQAPGASVFVLVVNANDEASVRKAASKGWRLANTLTRLGKALTMNHTIGNLCVAAVHELASAMDLAAVMLWIAEPDQSELRLASSVGVSRYGTSVFHSLSNEGAPASLPELVAQARHSISIPNASKHMLSADLEARICYLKPGAISVQPLVISDNLIGVLEMIAKQGDEHFEHDADLSETIGEHLSLALNSAMLYEQAERGAMHDPLTGIPNHRALQEFLSARLAEARRLQSELGVVMIDVDHFRRFNEEEGHDAGDQVLRMVAETLKQSVRPYDMAARYGGEEFTLVLPGAGRLGTLALAERARAAVESIAYTSLDGTPRKVTISLGCAIFPNAATEPQPLLKAADQALYAAKRSGRNQTAVYEGETQEPAGPARISLEAVAKRLRGQDRTAGLGLMERSQDRLAHLSQALSLEPAQREILNGILVVLPAYRDAIRRVDIPMVEALESAEEIRPLVAYLQDLHEWYDGSGAKGLKGDRLSKLVRAAQVLAAADSGETKQQMLVSGHYDPALVRLLFRKQRAA